MSRLKPKDTKRRNSRTEDTATPSRRSNGSKTSSHLKQGDDIFATFDHEDERAEERDRRREAGVLYVNYFWLPPGEEREVILLDDSLKAGAGIWEHNIKGPDGHFHREMCCKEQGPCALCEQEGESYFVLKTSVLDITGYTIKKGKRAGTVVEQQKCVLPIKRSQLPAIKDVCDAAMEEHGTLRGTLIKMRRPKDSQSSAIGEPVIVEKGKMYLHFTEKELKKDYGHGPIKDDKGKVMRPADFDITPYDFGAMFPEPDPEEIRKRFGGKAQPGSRQEADEEWDNTGKADEGDKSDRRGRGRQRAAQRREENSADDDTNPLARRGRSAAREERPAASRRRR